MSQSISLSLVGGTGLTGSATIRALMESRVPFDITSISRKSLQAPPTASCSSHLHERIVPNLFDAPSGAVAERNGVFVSCLGTTRSAAGGVENQRKLDADLNISLAEKAKADGADTVSALQSIVHIKRHPAEAHQMILVSSRGASAASSLAYPKMKGELEDAVAKMGFRRCVILRPGFLIGYRVSDNFSVKFGQNLFRGLRGMGLPMDGTMTDGSESVISTHCEHA